MAATTDDIKRHGFTVPRKKKINDSAETYEITVKGSGAFPVDMLRYDRCWPANQVDVSNAFTALDTRYETRSTIRLRSYDLPTIDRWRSFGWHVESIA